MGTGKIAVGGLVPMVRQFAPRAATGLFRTVLEAAVDGRGRFPGATTVGERHLRRCGTDLDQAVHDVIEQHVRLAGAQGFVTSLGGFAVLPLALPANITGLAVLQARMVASIAYLRGYDLADARVRTASIACLLGREGVESLVAGGRLSGTPLALATTKAAHDPRQDETIAVELGTTLAARVSGKRLGVTFSRRVPLLGGGVGAVVDAVGTYKVGRYADQELPGPR